MARIEGLYVSRNVGMMLVGWAVFLGRFSVVEGTWFEGSRERVLRMSFGFRGFALRSPPSASAS